MVKRAKIGVYGKKTRSLQKRLAYEATSLTWKLGNLYRYLGSRDSEIPDIDDIQVTTFMEVPDRAYDAFPININIWFEPAPEQVTDYSQFGVIDPIGTDQIIKVHVNSYADIGRAIIVGDVLEVPFFRQDSHEALWEVTDVDRSQEFEKYYAVVKMRVLEDSRKTREIDITGSIGPSLDDIVNAHNQRADDYVPHSGVDDSDIDNNEENDKLNDDYSGITPPVRKSFLDDFDGEL